MKKIVLLNNILMMKTMKYTKWIVLSVLTLVFFACNDDEETSHSITANAYIRGMMIDGTAKYAPVLVAESLDSPDSMTATDDNSGQYSLKTYWDYSLRYRWVPDTADYKTSIDDLTFTLLAAFDDGEEIEEEVSVDFDDVPSSFSITDLAYEASGDTFSVTWENTSADYYLISIAEDIDESPFFQSFSLATTSDANTLTTSFDTSTLNWFSTSLTDGTEYLLTVHAFNLNAASEVEGEFMAGKWFTWGE